MKENKENKKDKVNKINKDVLDELNKACTMGMDAINNILERVEDKKFKKVLEKEYDNYKELHHRIRTKYEDFSRLFPTETNTFDKVMTWSMTEIKLMKDNSISKMAELLIKGTNMGILEGKRILNHKEKMEKEVKNIVKDFIEMQEESIEIYQKYL